MLDGQRIAVVIPCFNVAAHLEGVLAGIPDLVDLVIVVDDGSADDTAAVAAASTDPRVELVRHPQNRGVAAAMISGIRRALARDGDVIVKMDGDDQMDPDRLPALLEPVVTGEADLAKGNRFLRRRPLRSMPVTRHLGNLALSFLAKLATGYWHLFDPTNGYLAVHRRLATDLELDRLGPRYYFEISLLCESYLLGAVARDVAMPARYGDESSSLSLVGTFLVFPILLARSCLRRLVVRYFLRDFTPVALFLLAGSGLCAFGLGFGIDNWITRAGTGVPTPTGTLLLALLPLLVGFQLLLQAAVMDIQNIPTVSPWRHVRAWAEERATSRRSRTATATTPAADSTRTSGSPGSR